MRVGFRHQSRFREIGPCCSRRARWGGDVAAQRRKEVAVGDTVSRETPNSTSQIVG